MAAFVLSFTVTEIVSPAALRALPSLCGQATLTPVAEEAVELHGLTMPLALFTPSTRVSSRNVETAPANRRTAVSVFTIPTPRFDDDKYTLFRVALVLSPHRGDVNSFPK
jgi:hypothetical protein